MNPLAYFADRWRQLAAMEGERDAVARGFALGVALGFTPLWGLKTLLALLIAPWVRGKRMAAVIGTTLHDVALPFAPAVLRFEYDVGYWILQRPHRWPAALDLHQLHPHGWLSWTTFFATVPPLLVGSVVIALPGALVAYAIVRVLLRKTAPRNSA